MKIWYITMQFPVPAETFACSDIKTLKRIGIVPKIFTLRAPHANDKRMLSERALDSISIDSNSLKKTIQSIPYLFMYVSKAIRLSFLLFNLLIFKPVELVKSIVFLPRVFEILHKIKNESPDVVHLFWGHYPSLLGLLVKEFNPNTVFSMFIGAYDMTMQYPLTSIAAKRADVFFTHSHSNESYLENMGISTHRLNVIHRGIDPIGCAYRIKTKDPYSILTAGRLIQSKGMDELIRAFALIRKRESKFRLKIAGDGPVKDGLLRLIRELDLEGMVEFLGHIDQYQLFEEMSKAKFFLFMSRKASERLPNVLKEAMYFGCCCITAPSDGIQELIPSDKYGIVLSSCDAKEASERLLQLSDSPDLLQKMRARSREWISIEFNTEIQMKKYISVWEKCLISH